MSDDAQDQVNRFVIVVAALVVLFAALLLILLAWGASSGSIERLNDLAGYLRDHENNEAKAIVSLAAAVVALAMIMVIVVELTPSPTERMRVRNLKSGDAVITTTEIARRVNSEVAQVPHIANCVATVAARGKRAEIVLDLHVDAGADLSQAADEGCRRTHVLVEQQMGIELAARPRARMHYQELRLAPPAKQAPAAPKQPGVSTGWERPATGAGNAGETRGREPGEGERDQPGRAPSTSEEAQA